MKKMNPALIILSILIFSSSCLSQETDNQKNKTDVKQETNKKELKPNIKQAYFAAGCFWCVEAAFDKIEGVISSTSGYTGGDIENPTYSLISSGTTKHIEALKVEYDATKTNYTELLKHFWKNVDPLDSLGQFCDKGPQYLGAIFYENESQKQKAEASLLKVQKLFKEKVATKILAHKKFYPAEQYHQDYYNKNPFRYKFYSSSCGRAKRLEAIWKDKELK